MAEVEFIYVGINIYFDEFKETQKIDESKIICDICKEHNKRDIFKI